MVEITQQNVHLLVAIKVCRVADLLMANNNMSLKDALQRVYLSETYKKLAQESTKYWHLGPVDLYQEICEEVMN